MTGNHFKALIIGFLWAGAFSSAWIGGYVLVALVGLLALAAIFLGEIVDAPRRRTLGTRDRP